MLKQSKFVNKPYLRVGLSREGRNCGRRVHQLVLEAFVGPCPSGMEPLHGDGDGSNNRLGNLRWGTKLENAADRIRHGTQIRGEAVWRAVLTEDQAKEIRDALPTWRHGDGRRFVRKFGVSDTVINSVKRGKTWKEAA